MAEVEITVETSDLLNPFRREGDIHLQTASNLFGVPQDKITPEQRRFGKLANYHRIYGGLRPEVLL